MLASSAHNLPRVSLIIPVYGESVCLLELVEAISAQDYPHDLLECVFVDNGCAPPLPATYQSPVSIQVVKEDQPGSYAARNRGVKESSGEILAFTDADCIPADDWISKGIQKLSEDDCQSVIAGNIQLLTAGDQAATLSEKHQLLHGFRQERYVQNNHFGATANLLVPRHIFDRVGEFNSRLYSSGDFEWGQRAHKMNVELKYGAKVIVSHPARKTIRELNQKYLRLMGGHYMRIKELQRSRVTFLSRYFTRSGQKVLRILFHPNQFSVGEKLQICALEIYLRCRQLLELSRLICGGHPRRH